ncbi:MAG: hypothetical protein WKF57_02805 [Nakamurella sp.]
MRAEPTAQGILRRRERNLVSYHLPWPRGAATETPTPPLEIGADLRVRAASVYDRSLLRTISIEGRAIEFIGLPPELASTLLGMQYLAAVRHRALRWPLATDHVIDHHHVPAGVVTTQATMSEFRLVEIGLLPGFRGQGHAVAVIRAIALSAAERGLPLLYRAPTAFMTATLIRRLGAEIVAEGASYLELRHPLPGVVERSPLPSPADPPRTSMSRPSSVRSASGTRGNRHHRVGGGATAAGAPSPTNAACSTCWATRSAGTVSTPTGSRRCPAPTRRTAHSSSPSIPSVTAHGPDHSFEGFVHIGGAHTGPDPP